VSPPHNSSHEGRTDEDSHFRPAHAPSSALRIHGTRARQRIAGIGHLLPLRFFIRITTDQGGLPCPSPEPAHN
jgi:hypothetical protein